MATSRRLPAPNGRHRAAGSESALPLAALRTLAGLADRLGFATRAGLTYETRRDLYQALGYKRQLTPEDYIARYRRNGVARRIVEALPKATWRGGAALIEDDDPEIETEFEVAWQTLANRLHVWPALMRADILAGLGRFAVLLIGAPGALESELPRLRGPDDVLYLAPFGEVDVTIASDDIIADVTDPRFGRPRAYRVRRTSAMRSAPSVVHWTRVIHVADGLLDDELFGYPRLEAVWNLLDDLEKVTGGGAEAFWQRAQQGYQFNLPPDYAVDAAELERLREQIELFVHGYQRFLRTQGVEVKSFGSDVADMDRNVDSILKQISAGAEIPLRMLTGSERGELASTQDEATWNRRVADRRTEYAGPFMVRELVARLIAYGALPEPDQYDVFWPELAHLEETERADVAVKLAEANIKMVQAGQPLVITSNEIRDRVLDMQPLETGGSDDDNTMATLSAHKARRQRLLAALTPKGGRPGARCSALLTGP